MLAVIAAPLYAPQNPYNIASLRLLDSLDPPFFLHGGVRKFLLGTDAQGRDVLSAILYGARLSFIVGGLAVLVAARGRRAGRACRRLCRRRAGRGADAARGRATGGAGDAGGAARRRGGPRGGAAAWLDAAAIPVLVCDRAGPLAAIRARRSRDRAAGARRDYVAAARLAGIATSTSRSTVLPNVLGPALVMFAMSLGLAVIDEATLSFLGVGLPPTSRRSAR